MLETIEVTPRGFQVAEFEDANGNECSLQQSSAMDDTERGFERPGSSYVWLGREPDRMHLHRDQVIELIALLSRWHADGNFGVAAPPLTASKE